MEVFENLSGWERHSRSSKAGRAPFLTCTLFRDSFGFSLTGSDLI